MSIIEKRFSAAAIILAEILLFALFASAQEIEATIRIQTPDSISVEGKLIAETSFQTNLNWSFLNSIAGAENLGARVSDFRLFDERRRAVSVKKLADGEYWASTATTFSYRVSAKPLSKASSMSHVSWLANEQGILMLADLLPQNIANKQIIAARIKIELPPNWKIMSGEKHTGENEFFVGNIGKSVFLVGKNWRELKTANLNLAISGERQFSDAEALSSANEVYEEYRKLFGEIPAEKAEIFLISFPKDVKFGRWTAETRGANLTIISAEMPFKSQAVQRLHEQLRHELFHLWLPNRLALSGNYDWFYEGFTVYQALKIGVVMNRIRFEDFLDTLAQAYNFDSFQNRKFSLIESSKNRWNGADNPLYARGMLAAFLIDAALLRESRGKRSIDEIFREVYRKHRIPSAPTDGNQAVLNILQNYSEINQTVENYINGAEPIKWKTDLETFGIEAIEENSAVRLAVKQNLSGRQKDLLDKLGYNNWRKIRKNENESK